MKSIFLVLILLASFSYGAFSQSDSDKLSTMDDTGKGLDTPSSANAAADADVVPKSDIPDAGVSEPAYGGDDADLPPKGGSPEDMSEGATDDGAIPSDDYAKPPMGKAPAGDYDKASEGVSDSNMGSDDGVSASGDDLPPPSKGRSTEPVGE